MALMIIFPYNLELLYNHHSFNKCLFNDYQMNTRMPTIVKCYLKKNTNLRNNGTFQLFETVLLGKSQLPSSSLSKKELLRNGHKQVKAPKSTS